MTTLLSAQSLTLDTGFGLLLDNVSLHLQQGDRIGLIGHNGCGKSTLLHLLSGELSPSGGSVTRANRCLLARVEQHLPAHIAPLSLLDTLLAHFHDGDETEHQWRAEALLAQTGFSPAQWQQPAATLSGGEHTRLLLARALILEPDVLLLDEPGNHLDLPTLLWLEKFLTTWNGSFILVSHDQSLLDAVTNCTWVLRDRQVQFVRLPCSRARQELARQDEADAHCRQAEQREIDRVQKSAARLALWGSVYDNEGLSRKAKQMEKRVDRLKDDQTRVPMDAPWQLGLRGQAMPADRLLAIDQLVLHHDTRSAPLYRIDQQQIKSGDRVALVGRNGSGKSSLLRYLWQNYHQSGSPAVHPRPVIFHPQCQLGYYDQSQQQVNDDHSLTEALAQFAPLTAVMRKQALITAGFAYSRHDQPVSQLSGGERSRLLFAGLSLARYHLLMLDEPTNHLDMAGKDQLAESLRQFEGGLLLVSHDRHLITKVCNRFWLIDEGRFGEWHDVETLWERVAGQNPQPLTRPEAPAAPTCASPDLFAGSAEHDLERLIELEASLAADLLRKARHQKPEMQQRWRQEIARLNRALGLD